VRRPRLPRLVRFLVAHAVVGFGLSTLATGAILHFDPDGLGTLLLRANGHPGPTVLLWFFMGLTLGGVQMAVAVMLSGGDDDGPGGGRRDEVPRADPLLEPVRIGRGTRASAAPTLAGRLGTVAIDRLFVTLPADEAPHGDRPFIFDLTDRITGTTARYRSVFIGPDEARRR